MALVTLGCPWSGFLPDSGGREVSDEVLFKTTDKFFKGGYKANKGDHFYTNQGKVVPDPDPEYGREWLEQNRYRQPDGAQPTKTQCELMGFKIRSWDFVNNYHQRIKPFPPVSPQLDPAGTPLPLPDYIVERRDVYNEQAAILKRDRKEALHSFAGVGKPEEQGLGLVQWKPDPVPTTDDVPYMDTVLGKVRGAHIRDETVTVPEGYRLVPITPPKKPRGKGFAKGFDPRRWRGTK
jgi:hypothetical protein